MVQYLLEARNADGQPVQAEFSLALTDLAATFLEVAGVAVPEQMTGKSLLPLINGKKDMIRDSVFMEESYLSRKAAIRDYNYWYIEALSKEVPSSTNRSRFGVNACGCPPIQPIQSFMDRADGLWFGVVSVGAGPRASWFHPTGRWNRPR